MGSKKRFVPKAPLQSREEIRRKPAAQPELDQTEDDRSSVRGTGELTIAGASAPVAKFRLDAAHESTPHDIPKELVNEEVDSPSPVFHSHTWPDVAVKCISGELPLFTISTACKLSFFGAICTPVVIYALNCWDADNGPADPMKLGSQALIPAVYLLLVGALLWIAMNVFKVRSKDHS